MIVRGTLIGLLSGILLGFILKGMEIASSLKVYTLLLNIDFIPVAGDILWPEWAEFLFHLLVAVILGIIFYYGAEKINGRVKLYLFAFLLTFPVIFLYFPLSMLAIKDVPAPGDLTAFGLWSAGHIFYILSLPVFYWLVEFVFKKLGANTIR
ncbi:hypothetical protein [Jeotgalibacillus campisalis]|uniref:Uncharacterized protein n=1 Tax=Jeotgalibacillus campisalis TaxID=220754 RepID=A0A0C2VFB8_9BACL|nr:hypothetical protein [Jeotgalibacillus campisalis]KIL47577.1 hypothetical protein KR50_17440 [Jeotgalibacillus campisalis]